MATIDRIVFDLKELTEILVKKADLNDGIWSLSVEFQLAVSNVGAPEDPKDLKPAVISMVKSVGLQRSKEMTSLCVDAAAINPRKGQG